MARKPKQNPVLKPPPPQNDNDSIAVRVNGEKAGSSPRPPKEPFPKGWGGSS